MLNIAWTVIWPQKFVDCIVINDVIGIYSVSQNFAAKLRTFQKVEIKMGGHRKYCQVNACTRELRTKRQKAYKKCYQCETKGKR